MATSTARNETFKYEVNSEITYNHTTSQVIQMTNDQRKLKRPTSQPVSDKGFSGKTPLVSGMLLKDDQVMASAILLQMVSRTMARQSVKKGYETKLLSLAKSISDQRRAIDINRMIEESISELKKSGVPKTKREALETALESKGIEPIIIDEKEGKTFTFFKVLVDGKERTVPLPDDVMEGDIIANVEKLLGIAGIVRDSTELMAFAAEESRSSRPPPPPIKLDLRELEKRRVNYDGTIGYGALHFTCYIPGIETSFVLSGKLKNAELLRAIDEKVLELHQRYGRPLDSSIAEQQASGRSRYRIANKPREETVVNTIHYLLSCGLEDKLLPEEYRSAVIELRSSKEYHDSRRIMPITPEERKEFIDAFKQLDNPAHVMARVMHTQYSDEQGNISEEGKRVIKETLQLGESGNIGIKHAALSNIATAYTLLSGNETSGLSEEELRQKHLEMMFTIRLRMKEITHNLVFKA